MKTLPAKLLILLFCSSALVAVLFLQKNKSVRHAFNQQDTLVQSPKDPNKLYPQELFYLDRNYPDFDPPKGIFQQRILQAIKHDKSARRSHRGLDFPWTVQGPGNIGGRVNTIAVHPLDSDVILIGFSQGGIYRTDDGGQTWHAVFDDQPSLSISHITFDVNNPQVVYAATGDVNISGYPFLGSGVYRSEDAGLTWISIGLQSTGVLSKVFSDPHNSDILYVGSMGYPSHKGNEKGLFVSIDRGLTWNQTLFVDDSTGIIDLVVDPLQPGRVFASAWTRIRTNTIGTTLGPGTGIYRSDDYGQSWIPLTEGLPGDYHSRTSIDMANDGTLFISYIGTPTEGECAGEIESLKGLYKSIDGGFSWTEIFAVSFNGAPCGIFGNFGWYFEALKVNPENSNDLFLLGVDMYRSTDGGFSWFPAVPVWWTYEVHADKHDLVFAGDKMYLGTDGGAYVSHVSGIDPWADIENIPSTQFYRTAFNPHLPDQYFGGAQDNGTTGGNESFINEWPRIFGGDGFQPLFDPDEPYWIYTLTQNGTVWFSGDGGFEFEELTEGLFGPRNWDMPLIMNPHDNKILFAASNQVFKLDMRDTIRVWNVISADLTKGVPILNNRMPSITSLAQSALDSLRLYAGTQDGNVWTSADGGMEWINISEGTPGFFVTSITTSTVNPKGVYVTYSGYRDGDHTPYIINSDDAGSTWSSIGDNLPLLGVNGMYILPDWNDHILFAATDGGVYLTIDKGFKWERLGTNFPYMPVYDIDYNPVMNTIVAATFSRGLMTFPVEELDLINSADDENPGHYLNTVRIYPTLAEDHLVIDFGQAGALDPNSIISIVDMNGRILFMHTISSDPIPGTQLEIQVDFPSGIYFTMIYHDKQSRIVGRFIKK